LPASAGHSLAAQQLVGAMQTFWGWHIFCEPHEETQAPAEHEAVPPVGAAHERVPCGAPLGTFVQVPRKPATSHAMQALRQVWLQQ
jgi:hypothetical protein